MSTADERAHQLWTPQPRLMSQEEARAALDVERLRKQRDTAKAYTIYKYKGELASVGTLEERWWPTLRKARVLAVNLLSLVGRRRHHVSFTA